MLQKKILVIFLLPWIGEMGARCSRAPGAGMEVDYLRLCSRASDNPAFIWFCDFPSTLCRGRVSTEGICPFATAYTQKLPFGVHMLHCETLGHVDTCQSFDKLLFATRKLSRGRGSLWNPAFCGSLAGHFRVTLQNVMSGSLSMKKKPLMYQVRLSICETCQQH